MSAGPSQPASASTASEQPQLRAERDAALLAARAALGDITRLTRLLTTLGEPGSIEALLDRTVTTLSELFRADVVALLTPSCVESCRILATIGLPETMQVEQLSSRAGTALHEALSSGRIVARLDPEPDPPLAEVRLTTALWVPIRDSQAAVIGVVLLGRCAALPFSDADLALLGTMAHRVGLAVEQAQRGRQFEQLAQAAHRIGRELQESVVLREAAQMFPEVVQAHAATVLLTGADGEVGCLVHSGLNEAELRVWDTLSEPLSACARGDGHAVRQVTDLAAHWNLPADVRIRATLAVPLDSGTRVQGVLLAYRFTTTPFNSDVIQLAKLYAAQLAAAVENARLLQAVRGSDDRFRALIRGVSDVIAILSREGQFLYVSPAASSVWQCEADQLIDRSFILRVHPDDRATADGLLVAAHAQPGVTVSANLRVEGEGQSWRDFEVSLTNQLDEPAVQGIIATYHDVTDRKAFETQLSSLAFRDTLSGLPNRASFMERLESALLRAKGEDRSVALLFIDLDNFKIINDSLGHAAGDIVLAEVARRLVSSLRSDDAAARLGGDEFTVLLERADAIIASRVAERIRAALAAPIRLPGQDVFVGASIGIALGQPGSDSGEELLRKADIAMYRAKSRGKAQHQLFDVSLDRSVQERLVLETDLRRAVERGELTVEYQPVVSLVDNRTVGIETLVRWKHPQRGLISPAQFIPLAEETGLIVPIGEHVLEQACWQLKEWNTLAPGPRERLDISVNLSARQFQDPKLVETVLHMLERTGLDASWLILEITETAVMRDVQEAIRKSRELKDRRLRLSMDDFGTGYSSLNYLKQFAVDLIKIDRSFISRIGEDSRDLAIVRSVLALADGLGLTVIAEGIEDAAQAKLLRSLGCPLGQGYGLARPQSAAELTQLLLREWGMPQEAAPRAA